MPKKTLDSFFARLRSTPEYRIEVGIIGGYNNSKNKRKGGAEKSEWEFLKEKSDKQKPEGQEKKSKKGPV